MRAFVVGAAFFLLTTSLFAKSPSGLYSSPELDELRLEIEDLKQAIHVTQVDLSLVDERAKKQEGILQKQGKEKIPSSSQVIELEKRISSLEKSLDKVMSDLRLLNTSFTTLTSHLTKVQGDLAMQEAKIGEVSKLKGTLTSLTQAIRSSPASEEKLYQVKAGDSLEKIAREHHISVKTLRDLNHLSQDKIIVGQQLRVTDGGL